MPNKMIKVVDDIAELRTLSRNASKDIARVGTSDEFSFDSTSLTADDGVDVIKPTILLEGQPGRWLRRKLGSDDLEDDLGGSPGSALVAVSVFDTSANAYETQLELAAAEGGGMFVTGSIKNTGADDDAITVKETVDGANFEAPQSIEHDLTPGQYMMLDTLLGAVGIGVPPYQSYKIEIKSKVADTPANFQLMAQLIGEIVEINE